MDDIERGVIALPDLQRPFVWEDTKVRGQCAAQAVRSMSSHQSISHRAKAETEDPSYAVTTTTAAQGDDPLRR
jgi:hypothetical protein